MTEPDEPWRCDLDGHLWADSIFGGYVCDVCDANPTPEEREEHERRVRESVDVRVTITRSERR